ncbi:hypothetical protein AA0614_0737 [Komagataeibacter saccharivorans NRIC 0614]|nr:hypothetical protein AA0614_0737 [Komagataeibacter saccharivorans NRIC 0614]
MKKCDIPAGVKKGRTIFAQQYQRPVKQGLIHISGYPTCTVIGHHPGPLRALGPIKGHAPGIKTVHKRAKGGHRPA